MARIRYRCVRCNERFTAFAAAQRHANGAHHGRLEMADLGEEPK